MGTDPQVHPEHFGSITLIYLFMLQWKVRRTLAFSIHELAVILGDQLTAGDLVPVFNGFLKDLDEVRIGVLKHLHDFLKVWLCSALVKCSDRFCFISLYALAFWHNTHVTVGISAGIC